VYGAYHAIQPGHGKTIAAAYIVGARGRPVDAWILGIFVTLSHTSGIVLVGVLASLGLPGLGSHRIEAWLAVATGVLVILLGLWTLWTQRHLFQVAGWERRQSADSHAHSGEVGAMQYRPHEHDDHAPRGLPGAQAHVHGDQLHHHDHDQQHAHGHDHAHSHTHGDLHAHSEGESAGYHTHGWGFKHTHDMALITTNRPSLWILIWLGLAGVLVFSLGFATVLVLVGVIASWAGKRILDWLAGSWAARLQIATSLIIVVVGIVLTVLAWQKVSQLT
jgi:nickel/cobalt exporter